MRWFKEFVERKNKMNMDTIWEITEPNDFVVTMMEHLEKKTEYGDDMSGLTRQERIFYITQLLEMEVNNGGFGQFFYNSSGDFSNEIVSAFQEIGAKTTADICQKAIDAWGCELPVDRDDREDLLGELETEQIDDILEECDNAFFDYEDDLSALNHEYAKKNKEYFD